MTTKTERVLNASNLPLRYSFSSIRQAITDSPFLDSLSKCDALLDKEMNSDLTDLNSIDSQIRSILEKIREIGEEDDLRKISVSLYGSGGPFSSKEAGKKALASGIKTVMKPLAKTLRNSQRTLPSRLEQFKQQYVRNHRRYPLPIDVRVLYRCPGCNMIFVELNRTSCHVCDRPINRRRDSFSIQLLDSAMKSYIEKNVWLEDAVARAMRKAHFKDVISGATIAGRSGFHHEVDVLGTLEGKVVVCECTTASGGLDKISSLFRIKTDLAAHWGLLVSVGEVPRDVGMFAKTYDISVVANVLENPSSLDGTLEQIRIGLSD